MDRLEEARRAVTAAEERVRQCLTNADHEVMSMTEHVVALTHGLAAERAAHETTRAALAEILEARDA